MSRTFEDKPAIRERVPLLIGTMGPSGGGKTFSDLRLATGIQRITGGDIYVIDTEAKRALHYADIFNFRHIPFNPPFGSLDYMAAIDHCVKKGAGVIIVDSMTHEHSGQGGHLESHESETERLAKAWNVSRDKAQMPAWAKPKADRTKLINYIVQSGVTGIFSFRAKEKVKMPKSRDEKIVSLGFMPIAGEEFLFEMTVNCLLLPAAGGVPTWRSDEIGERMMIKLPKQFEHIFSEQKPLDESIGESLAKWAKGAETKTDTQAPAPEPFQHGKLIEAFAELGITQTMIESRLEHSLAVATELEIKNLRKVYVDVKSGKEVWA